MKIAVVNPDGTVVDTYDGVESGDVMEGVFCQAIQKWLFKTLERSEREVFRWQNEVRALEAEIKKHGKLVQAARFTNLDV